MPGAANSSLLGDARAPRSLRRPRHARLLATAGAALALLLFPALHRPQLRLVWNASASVPLGLYRIELDARPSVGDMVALRPSPWLTRFMAERRYVEDGALLVKPVAAVGGASVCRIGVRVTIDRRPVARARPHDRFGRPLPRWSGCLRLGPDQLFLIAPLSATSFDSRYFGVVRRGQIVGRAVPLWTWS
jgi:conjugative transfer signal peptidase TraF